MSRFVWAIAYASFAFSIVACNSQPPQPTIAATEALPAATATSGDAEGVATATTAPSVTPPATATATETAPPTATETPAASPTITPPPTPDPNEGVGDVVFEDALDGTGNWYWTFDDDTANFGVSTETKELIATAKQSGSWRYTISNDVVTVGDQQVRVTAKALACAASDEYGLMFRGQADAEGNYNLYIFDLNCSGAARMLVLQGSELYALSEWQTNPAIKPGAEAENTLMVWMAKDQFRFYVNEAFLFEVQDATLNEGFYGFFLRDNNAGTMSVSFKNLVAKEVTVP